MSTQNAFGQGYPWDTIGDNIAGGTVVDIGGSIGTSSILLARRFSKLKFIVQDLPGPIANGKDAVPADVSDRVEFIVHDFFTEQPVNADAYFSGTSSITGGMVRYLRSCGRLFLL